jgi:hypothetical protein
MADGLVGMIATERRLRHAGQCLKGPSPSPSKSPNGGGGRKSAIEGSYPSVIAGKTNLLRRAKNVRI